MDYEFNQFPHIIYPITSILLVTTLNYFYVIKPARTARINSEILLEQTREETKRQLSLLEKELNSIQNL